jgi:hypothetical protein
LHKKTGELKPDEILLSVLSARVEAVRIVIEALHIKVEALKIRRAQVDREEEAIRSEAATILLEAEKSLQSGKKNVILEWYFYLSPDLLLELFSDG